MSKRSGKHNSLFIEEEEEDVHSQLQYAPETIEEDDDPIVDSIPLVLNDLPSTNVNKFHVIQYPGRSKNRPLEGTYYKSNIKKETNFLEVKLPLDTSRFFNAGKADEWGEDVGQQTLNGVLNRTEGGLYVGKIVTEGNNKKVVLVPVESTTQLRTSFKYIDDIDASNQAQRKAEAAENNKPNNIQILQSASKSGAQITHGDGFGNALGESLKQIKKFEDEEWVALRWETADGTTASTIKQEVFANAPDQELSTESSLMNYIDDLTSS
ncbi:DNA-directed RNA polymerase III subunit Rpc5 [Scheffersomyces coipomensis]|uniref:DNA-directed RNA polymerase III subunit Rpc5 n=1 Tax=Scheffersomyces coipomensis TaxID=1788519 RepID=UPI00315C52DE